MMLIVDCVNGNEDIEDDEETPTKSSDNEFLDGDEKPTEDPSFYARILCSLEREKLQHNLLPSTTGIATDANFSTSAMVVDDNTNVLDATTTNADYISIQKQPNVRQDVETLEGKLNIVYMKLLR